MTATNSAFYETTKITKQKAKSGRKLRDNFVLNVSLPNTILMMQIQVFQNLVSLDFQIIFVPAKI